MKLRLAPQQSPHPGQQFAERKRLCQIVVGAGIEPGNAIVYGRARSQHQHWRGIAAGAQFAAHFKSVRAGQEHIEENQIVVIN